MTHRDSSVCGHSLGPADGQEVLEVSSGAMSQCVGSIGRNLKKSLHVVKSDIFGIPLLSSVAIHIFIFVIMMASVMPHAKQLRRQDLLPISLVDLPRPEPSRPAEKIEAPPEVKKSLAKADKSKENKPAVKKETTPVTKVEIIKPEPPPPLLIPAEEAAKLAQAKPSEPVQTEVDASLPSDSRVEGGGSEAGAGSHFVNGDVGVLAGPGTAAGGGRAFSGLKRGSGAPGLPAQASPIVTNRQAKPIQIMRASYPPMALRAGLESDVALRIEVDTEGKVTKAEITQSGGAGFDEEALKAVKQSRFEPAQKNGQHVPAEFTYIYRFRLRR